MTIERLERESVDRERLEAVRALFPEVMSDGRVNVDRLKELLEGETDDVGPGDSHYGLSWPGREAARRAASKPPSGSLRPVPGEGVDEATTRNMLIVGDNLEVLRLLQRSYANRVKLIYIDPPYNTGSDFIYKDNFADPVSTYLEATRQADFSGVLTSNPKSSGRYHSAWLSMMYPRLALARNLLRSEDGVIFVSIDDHEVHNLRLLMDEIFGSENFITSVIWQKVYSPKNTARHFSEDHDYILVYARNAEAWAPELLPRTDEQNAAYKNPDNDPRGPWKSGDLSARNFYSQGTYSITCPSGRVIKGPPPGTYWRYSKEKFLAMDTDGRIWWGADGNNTPSVKRFLSEVKDGRVPQTLWKYEDVGHTQEAKKELLERVKFDSSDSVFDTPKPSRLIEQVLKIGTSSDGENIVLDFFAGSGTTGEAVWKLNRADGGDRRFILVQLPEVTGQNDYKTIADITRTRLKNASAALKKEGEGKLDFSGEKGRLDLGFRVLYQDRTNVQRWAPYDGGDASRMLTLFNQHEGLTGHWRPENVLIETMLLEGYPLDSERSQHPDFLDNVVTVIEHPSIPVPLLVCLDDELAEETADVLSRPDFGKVIFVCLEGAVTDTVKVRLADVVHQVKTL